MADTQPSENPAETPPADPAAGQTDSGSQPETGQTPSGETAPPANGETADWRAGIPDDLKDMASRFNSPADAVKAAKDLRQKLSNAIHVPGEDASEEDRTKFLRAIGVPESPDGYEIRLPENVPDELRPNEEAEARFQRFREAMHEAGAPKGAAEAAIRTYYDMLVEEHQARAQEATQKSEEAVAGLRQQWGRDFDANVRHAQHAADEFGLPKDWLATATVDGVPLGNHPNFLKAFAAIGRRVGEDGFHAAEMTEDRQKSLEQKHRELTAQMHAANQRGDKQEALRLQDERAKISEQLTGGGPLVGANMRTF